VSPRSPAAARSNKCLVKFLIDASCKDVKFMFFAGLPCSGERCTDRGGGAGQSAARLHGPVGPGGVGPGNSALRCMLHASRVV
jgi:hypothetical protein